MRIVIAVIVAIVILAALYYLGTRARIRPPASVAAPSNKSTAPDRVDIIESFPAPTDVPYAAPGGGPAPEPLPLNLSLRLLPTMFTAFQPTPGPRRIVSAQRVAEACVANGVQGVMRDGACVVTIGGREYTYYRSRDSGGLTG